MLNNICVININVMGCVEKLKGHNVVLEKKFKLRILIFTILIR